ncbi:hypothetical protein Sste5346_009599 [Sporothrix stenoceras]|uniref:MARVEL domain-containing protein n=1 Tax=Sporothrix stenoceras TaxID=5173 RepID=A0ABR3YJG8_9PEZI
MSLSPRQVESVEQWLDEQPLSEKKRRTEPLPMTAPPAAVTYNRVGRSGAFKEEMFTNTSRPNYSRPQHPTVHPPLADRDRDHDRDLHVHSRLQMHSRFSRHPNDDAQPDDTDFVDPIECFLRVCSACLGSAALAVGAVTYVLVHRSASTPTTGTPLDNRLGWVIAVPVAAAALLWQLTRLSLLAWHGRRTTFLLGLDLFAESVLAVGSVICSILAGFQAARHAAYNKKHVENKHYTDIGPEISLVVLLAFLSFSSFGILALNVVEANRRRRENSSSNRSTSSSVIEIIHRH